jgi:hypothetical protein
LGSPPLQQASIPPPKGGAIAFRLIGSPSPARCARDLSPLGRGGPGLRPRLSNLIKSLRGSPDEQQAPLPLPIGERSAPKAPGEGGTIAKSDSPAPSGRAYFVGRVKRNGTDRRETLRRNSAREYRFPALLPPPSPLKGTGNEISLLNRPRSKISVISGGVRQTGPRRHDPVAGVLFGLAFPKPVSCQNSARDFLSKARSVRIGS